VGKVGYSKEFVAALEFVWGEGFLSPGGPEEVRAILGKHDLRGARVLDIGCGLGGIDLLLVSEHGAGQVVGIDVNPDVIMLARALAERKGLSHAVSFEPYAPGPLPFPCNSFDVVFSKDAMVHVPDKKAFYPEIMRVLKPGGRLMASDWLWKPDAANDPLVKAWVGGNHLGFVFTTVAEARAALEATGFEDIAMIDRHREIAAVNRAEVARLEGPILAELAARVGEEVAKDRLRSARGRQPVLDAAALIPTHLHGRKPDR
jgi:phosphoethanolamine N-methyltransferase